MDNFHISSPKYSFQTTNRIDTLHQLNVAKVEVTSATFTSNRFGDSQALLLKQISLAENVETKTFEKDTPQSADKEMSSDSTVSVTVHVSHLN